MNIKNIIRNNIKWKIEKNDEYSDFAINKFLSFYTPKEIIIDELNFQQGWEVKGYKKIGRDIVKVVKTKGLSLLRP